MLSNIWVSSVFFSCSAACDECLQWLFYSNPSGVVSCSIGRMFSVAINSLLELLSFELMIFNL